jgi:hypothetical protein
VGLQLVEAPKMAQRPDIGFARKAKRADNKALKTAKREVTCSLYAVAFLIPSADTRAGIMAKVSVASDAKFADVSVPYRRIRLLHICNE